MERESKRARDGHAEKKVSFNKRRNATEGGPRQRAGKKDYFERGLMRVLQCFE